MKTSIFQVKRIFGFPGIFFYFLFGYLPDALAQFGLPQARLSDERESEFVVTNATLIPEPGKRVEKGSIYVRNGLIEAIGTQISVPAHVLQIDAKGAWVYPSFIDVFSGYGQPPPLPPTPGMDLRSPQFESNRPQALGWNQALKPDFSSALSFQPNPKEAEELRKLGFGWVFSTPRDGIMRGNSALVCLQEKLPMSGLIRERGFPGLSFQKGSSSQQYPSSQMGAIALLRQTFIDASFWEATGKKEPNLMLDAVQKNRSGTWIFETHQKYEVLRAATVAREAGIRLLIKTRGDEYQRLEEIRSAGFPLVVPLQFPDLPDVEDPLDASVIPFSDLKHWELAPYNPALLQKSRIPFCFTLRDLKDAKTFPQQIRKAVRFGLSEADALAALTTEPARFAGIEQLAGKLKPGMKAAFFLCSENFFSDKAVILEHFLPGRRFVHQNSVSQASVGTFLFRIGGNTGRRLVIKRQNQSLQAEVVEDSVRSPLVFRWETGKVSFYGKLRKTDTLTVYQFTGWSNGPHYEGWVQGGNAGRQSWAATFLEDPKELAPGPRDSGHPDSLPEIWYPAQAFGRKEKPVWKSGSWLIRNATVWTNEKEGILSGADVWVENGKIKSVGKGLPSPEKGSVKILDGTGKHLTCGIIDEHSHIAISKGVNEGSSTTSSEVRIGDVIEPDDINIYRHLAGGVTAVQQLHGSANAIGGQSSLIKMRWGSDPDGMKIEGASGFIKFALGENVKQSNWGDFNTIRYPQTRMGVEQLFYDAFSQARTYIRDRDGSVSKKFPFRRDLKLEALAEILEKKRFITCHSYVQSEINMLMHVGDSMGFRVNTFTHILEGYKVADKMKRHGAGASTFSDWWAYKMEVKDAIPFNAALMHQKGLVVAINSDDAEMATRLNQEAAKAVKYGGVSEEDAWKMVTLHPARLLHLDDRMGSIRAGKEADLVLWSGNPLSISARAEKTFVDGTLVFDWDSQPAMQARMEAERNRIVQKMLKAKQAGQATVPPVVKVQHLWHCDDEGEE